MLYLYRMTSTVKNIFVTFMEKIELFKYLQSIEDKSGGFKKPDSIKKNYPEIYDELERA